MYVHNTILKMCPQVSTDTFGLNYTSLICLNVVSKQFVHHSQNMFAAVRLPA